MSYMPPDPGEPGSALEELVRVYDGLQHPNAVKWAKDGRLALLTNSRVDVFAYPGEELDPYYRWTVPLHEERRWAQCCGTLAAQRAYEHREALLWMMQRSTGGDTTPAMLTAMDWSPVGCAWDGGCLLATLSSDGVLDIWAPPLATRATQWAQIGRITDLLEAHLLRTRFAPEGVSDALAAMAAVTGQEEGLLPSAAGAAGGEQQQQQQQEGGGGGRVRARAKMAVGAEEEDGSVLQDAGAWAVRQDMAGVTAVAWCHSAVAVGGEEVVVLMAVGGPRLVHVWAFAPPALSPSAFGPATAAAATVEGEEGDGGGWEEEVTKRGPKASAFPDKGTLPPKAPAAHCLAPLPAPVAVWEAGPGGVAQLAWSHHDGGGDGTELLLAVATAYGAVDVVRLTYDHHLGQQGQQGQQQQQRWAVTPLLALSGADYGVVQSLSFGHIHLAATPPPPPPATAEEGDNSPLLPPPLLAVTVLVAAKGTALHAWAMPEGRPLAVPLEAAPDPLMGLDWARAPDGSETLLLTAGMDGGVQAWRFVVARPTTEGQAPNLALVVEPALSALIPSRREALMGLAVSPNGLALAVARVAEGDEGNSRLLQFNRKLRRNHAMLGVQPLWQTGWRSVVLPGGPVELLAAMGWFPRLLTATAAASDNNDDGTPALLDVSLVAALDFSALIAAQVHVDFLTPQGTAPAGNGNAKGSRKQEDKMEVDGEEEEEERGEGEEEASIKAESSSVKRASAAGRGNGNGKKKRPGRRRGGGLEAPVDTSALPAGSHDLLPYTAYSRLAALLGQWPGLLSPPPTNALAVEGQHGQGQFRRPPCAWQALHALHAHVSQRCLEHAPHMQAAAAKVQGRARLHLTAAYVDRSLSRLLLLQQEEGLSKEERRVVWAMARWLRGRRGFLEEGGEGGEGEGGPPMRQGGGTWEELAAAALRLCGLAANGGNEAALAAELEERCFLCDSALVPLEDDASLSVECQLPEAPHRLARCMETFRVVDSAECWSCPLCAAVARPHLPPPATRGAGGAAAAAEEEGAAAGGDGGWPFEARPAWLAPFHGGKKGGVWCLWCHVPCRLTNT